jgi:hypothetical protein
MRLQYRVPLVASFGLGYYFGSKAGRMRYEQIQRWLHKVRQSGPVEKAQAAVDPMVERIRQRVEAVTGTANGPGASSERPSQSPTGEMQRDTFSP